MSGDVGWLDPIARREFLSRLAKVAGAASIPALLNACSFETQALDDALDDAIGARTARRSGTVDFANWPYYIDRERDGSHPSLERFTESTGITVNYTRPIRDNGAFLDAIRPDLAAGRSTGYDLAVISNGPELFELISRAWLAPIDRAHIPNFARFASDGVRDPVWDLGNQYTIAWQSGVTGIAYRDEAVKALGYTPRSVRDLFNPALEGRVGMFRDLNDLGSFGLLAIDVTPATSSPDSWQEAAALLRDQRDSVLRGYYDQGYVGALRRGTIWATQAWSGDIFQQQQLTPGQLSFVVPDEGAMFWTDNMVIPYTAEHPIDAMQLMNFVYRPRIAALIADAVRYTCPVPYARRFVKRRLGHPAVANSPFVFPPWNGPVPVTATEDVGPGLASDELLDYFPFVSSEQVEEWRLIFGGVVAGH